MKWVALFVAGALWFPSAPAFAQSETSHPPRLGVAGRMSTLGVGFDFGVPVKRRADLRVAVNLFSYSHTYQSNGFDLDASLTMRSIVVQLDWHVFKGGFHVSPGLMFYNGIRLEATMSAPNNQPFSLGDETFISSTTNPMSGAATVSFKKVAPTLTFGWGSLIPRKGTRRWSIPIEIGLVSTKSPIATLSMKGGVCWVNATNCRDLSSEAQLQRDITKAQSDMNNDLKPLKILPILSVGFSYRF